MQPCRRVQPAVRRNHPHEMSSLDAVMAKLALKTGSWDAELKRRRRHRRMAETEAMAFEDGYSRHQRFVEDGFREGDAVEADFRGRGRYYAGKITSVREDGSYDILYEDGDAEACVAPESVRRRSEEPEVARPETGEPAISVGDAVDAAVDVRGVGRVPAGEKCESYLKNQGLEEYWSCWEPTEDFLEEKD